MSSVSAPDPKAPAIWGSIWSVWGIAAAFVVLRFKARSIRGLSWAADDWMAVVALFFSFCVCIASSLAGRFGVGKHIWDVSTQDLEAWNKSLFYGNLVYVGTGPSTKISALLMYQRVFASPRFRLVSWILIGVCAAWWIGEIFGSIWNCVPISGFWDKSINARCITTRNFDLQYAIINISLDAIILALPVKMIMGLQLSRAQKFAFVLVFLMGGFATAAAIVRLIIFIRNLKSTDETYVWYEGVIWSCLEPCIAVMSICLPLMRPVILAVLPDRWRQSLLSKTDHLFKGTNDAKRRNASGRGNLSSNFSHKFTRNPDADQTGGSFERLHGGSFQLESLQPTHDVQAVGTQAFERPVDEDIEEANGIVKRTDVVLQYETTVR